VLTAFTRAFRTPDLRKKLLFTLFIIAVFRLGSQIPTPGVDVAAVREAIEASENGANANVYQLVNLFSGGALLKLSVFALGIMPYITASIIMQLLTVVIPRLESLKKEGQAGTTKITQYTRYLTVGLAILQSTGLVAMAATGQLFGTPNDPNQPNQQDILLNNDFFTIATMVLTMTAGTAVIMWLGELITDRGVGNGMSLLIFTQVIAVFPA
jgi:preprotein translocase subunit SecY